jgi:hypothetical protein
MPVSPAEKEKVEINLIDKRLLPVAPESQPAPENRQSQFLTVRPTRLAGSSITFKCADPALIEVLT